MILKEKLTIRKTKLKSRTKLRKVGKRILLIKTVYTYSWTLWFLELLVWINSISFSALWRQLQQNPFPGISIIKELALPLFLALTTKIVLHHFLPGQPERQKIGFLQLYFVRSLVRGKRVAKNPVLWQTHLHWHYIDSTPSESVKFKRKKNKLELSGYLSDGSVLFLADGFLLLSPLCLSR